MDNKLFESLVASIRAGRLRRSKMKESINDRTKMTIVMEVTESQGLALQAMFEYWNYLANIGG